MNGFTCSAGGGRVELMAASDLVVLSSDHEGLPIVVMEALALGRPVVATAVGGLPEAVGDGRGGLVVPPRDPGLGVARPAGDEGVDGSFDLIGDRPVVPQ